MYRGNPPKWNIFMKKLYIYLYMFKLQSPSKYSPSDAIHLSRYFFHCSKQFLNSSSLTLFNASAIVCFVSSTLAKNFPLRTFFSSGETKKKSHLGQDQVNREGGTQGTCCFWSKTTEHSMWCGQVWS